MWPNRWIVGVAVLVICCAGTVWYGYSSGKRLGMTSVQSAWDAERAATAAAQAEEVMKARQREQALQALADRLRQEKRDEAKRLAAAYAADLERLRNRPEARAGDGGVPEGAAAGVGCTGQGLARGDAAFLSRYAHDAARLQLALDQCQTAYGALMPPVR